MQHDSSIHFELYNIGRCYGIKLQVTNSAGNQSQSTQFAWARQQMTGGLSSMKSRHKRQNLQFTNPCTLFWASARGRWVVEQGASDKMRNSTIDNQSVHRWELTSLRRRALLFPSSASPHTPRPPEHSHPAHVPQISQITNTINQARIQHAQAFRSWKKFTRSTTLNTAFSYRALASSTMDCKRNRVESKGSAR